MNRNDIEERLNGLERRVKVGTNSNRSSPSSVADAPNHEEGSSRSEEDELFPLLSAAEIARLPLPDSTVFQRELTETCAWLAPENCIIMREIGNLTRVKC